MPFIPLLQAIGARLLIGIVAVLGLLGLDSIATQQVERQAEESEAKVVQEITEYQAYFADLLGNELENLDSIILEEPAPSVESAPQESTEGESLPNPPEEDSGEIAPPPPQTQSQSNASLEEISDSVSGTIVNILCISNSQGSVQPISGSGIIIDPRGVILTNAHVAQYLLLKDYPIEGALDCIARTGSPAKAAYTVEPLYISPEWIRLHAEDIVNQNPRGTGEHDFALLQITGPTNPDVLLPALLPFIPISVATDSLIADFDVLIKSYPAGFLGSIEIQKNLFSLSTIGRVSNLFTFDTNTVDLLGISGSLAAQGGSSGGAVINSEGLLIGLIVTASREESTSERELRAITTGHINRSMIAQRGTSISALLASDLSATRAVFSATIAPTLRALLLSHL